MNKIKATLLLSFGIGVTVAFIFSVAAIVALIGLFAYKLYMGYPTHEFEFATYCFSLYKTMGLAGIVNIVTFLGAPRIESAYHETQRKINFEVWAKNYSK
jgi:hypothetical protein